MLDNLDELIELNLKLLYNAPNMYMWRIDFRNEKGQKLQDSLRFAKILAKEGLIDLEPGKMYRCELTKFGRDIVIGDGWIKNLEMEKENRLKENIKTSTIIAENYIGGDNHGIQSSKSDFINPEIHNASKTIASNPPKRSFLEIASWVFGIVVAIIAIYEFILKKL
jgi:hypothetical protein